MKVQGVLSAIKTTVGGLNNQMKRLELIADNIANADKTADVNGKLYQRKLLVEKETNGRSNFSEELNLKMKTTHGNHFSAANNSLGGKDDLNGYEVVEHSGELLVFEPNHPMANEEGYIRKPDVNLVEEMVDLMSATRIYEANVTVINAAKQLAKKSMEI